MEAPLSPEWDSTTKRTVALISFLGFLLIAWAVRSIFPLTIISALIAFTLSPLVGFLTNRVFRSPARRGLATLIAFLFGILFVIIIPIFVIPPVVDQFQEFGRTIPRRLSTLERELETFLGQPLIWNDEPILLDGEPFVPLDRIEEATGTRDLAELLQLDALTFENIQAATSAFLNSARSLSEPAFSFLGGAFATVINTTFLLMMTFYLMKDGGVFMDTLVNLVPESSRGDAIRLRQDLTGVWNAYIRGQLLLCLVMGVSTYLATSALGLPNATTLGLLAGILEFIPNLGPLIALIPAVFLALVSESSTITLPSGPLEGVLFALVVILAYTLLQNLEAIILVPRIMGDNLDLHPFVVLIAVLGGGALTGALGVIFAAPFIASGRVLARYIYGKLTGKNPFDTERHSSSSPPLLARLLLSLWLGTKWLIRQIRQRLGQEQPKQGMTTSSDAE